jgi:hypothetical protein
MKCETFTDSFVSEEVAEGFAVFIQKPRGRA